MKRNWATILDLLKATEEDRLVELLTEKACASEYSTSQQETDKLERISSDYYGHLELLVDDDAIRGVSLDCGPGGVWSCQITRARLSSAGFDLLGALESKGIWNRVTTFAKENAVPISCELVRSILIRALQ